MYFSAPRNARRVMRAALALIVALGFQVSGSGNATAAVSTTQTFSNTAAITINDSFVPPTTADPYPSPITVSGVTGTVTKVTVTLHGFSHPGPSDVDILLVGPGGQMLILMSDAGGSGGGCAAVGLDLTFDDAAAAAMTDCPPPLATGSYKPTNLAPNAGDIGADAFPAPAPPGPYTATALSVFNGLNPNGTWNLFVVDDASLDAGSISGGWSLSIESASVLISTGTGPTGGPHVKLFAMDNTGAVTQLGGGFFAYDSGFLGGVQAAPVKVGSDLYFVTGVGSGGGPHIKLFKVTDLKTGAVTQIGGGFFAYASSFTGGARVAATTDVNGNLLIITGVGSGGGAHVRVFRVTNLLTGDVSLIAEYFAYDPAFTGGVNVGGL